MTKEIVATCTKCKNKMFKNFGTKTFCHDCGTELPEVKEYDKCKYCGKSICGNYKFCSGCGKELEKDKSKIKI